MSKPPATDAKLPPPTAGQCWAVFLKWVVGVPLVVVGGLAGIAGALWLAGGQELMWRTTTDMGTALFWIAAISLMYPAMLFIWVADLRDGLRAARAWAALTPEAQAAALAEAEAAAQAARPRRRARKKG
jgi:hypothetical protein